MITKIQVHDSLNEHPTSDAKSTLLAIQRYHSVLKLHLSVTAFTKSGMHFHHLWQTGSLPSKGTCCFCYSTWQMSTSAYPHIQLKQHATFVFLSADVIACFPCLCSLHPANDQLCCFFLSTVYISSWHWLGLMCSLHDWSIRRITCTFHHFSLALG